MQISVMDSGDASSSSSSPSLPYHQIDIYVCTYTQVRGEKCTDGCVCGNSTAVFLFVLIQQLLLLPLLLAIASLKGIHIL